VEVQLHAFLTSALHGSEWSASRFVYFTPDTNFIEGWVGWTRWRRENENSLLLPGI